MSLPRVGGVELEVVRFLENLGGCPFFGQPQDVVGIFLGFGNWRVALAWAGELEVVALSYNLRMRLCKTFPRLTGIPLGSQHADHVEDAGLTVRLGSIWMVRRHGEGGGSSLSALITASSSAGGRCVMATRLALRSREASSRELSMVTAEDFP